MTDPDSQVRRAQPTDGIGGRQETGATQDALRTEVRAALTVAGISQASAATQLGLSQKHVSQMLTGRAPLGIGWAERILALCGLRLHVSTVQSDAPAGDPMSQPKSTDQPAPSPGMCTWPDCLSDKQQAELAAQVQAVAGDRATTPTPDQRLVCRCTPAPESVPDSPTVGSADGPLVAQHRFTVAPHDPDAIRAATERAMQAAADSEKDDALFRKATGDGASVADLLSFPIATHNPQNGQPWERCECGHVEIAHGSRVSCRECLCEQFAIPAAGTTPDSPAADTEPPDGPLVLDRAAATAMRDCLNQLLGDEPAVKSLRERYAAALAALDCSKWETALPGEDHPFWNVWRATADAVLAVRDDEVARLRAELAIARRRTATTATPPAATPQEH